jgi:general secretion pathway protein G
MRLKKEAFTMIELVFVIVVLGILSAIAIPKFAVTRTDAQITKGRADVASVRSAIITERQARLITGDNKFIEAGTGSGQLDSGGLFGGVLTYPITASDSSGHWHSRASSNADSSTVKFKVADTDVTFTYTRSNGVFTCDRDDDYCKDMID